MQDAEMQDLPAGLDEAKEQEEKDKKEAEKDENTASIATQIRDLIMAQDVTFAVDEVNDSYAKIKVIDHYEVIPVMSRAFKDIVMVLAEEEFRRVIPQMAFTSALESISARARRSTNKQDVAVRVKYLHEQGKIYLDLCNDSWQVIEVDTEGWRVLDNSPVWFVRTDDMDELPQPQKVSNQNNVAELSKLKQSINFSAENNFDLYISWLLSNLLSDVSVPILVLQGAAGAGKSFTSEVLRSVIDPHKKMKSISRVRPTVEVIILDASQNRILCYDNFSSGTISAEISDLFATISTNGATSKRALYTDNVPVIVKLGRSMLFNGIDDLIKRQDLLSRSIVINLEELKDRKTEKELRGQFVRNHAAILGALLNVASAALKLQGFSQFKGSRFSDWGQFVENGAIGALNWKEGHFEEIYLGNVREAEESLLHSNYFISGVLELVENSGIDEISYFSTSLINAITDLEDVPNDLPHGAIPNPIKVRERLNRDKSLLKRAGLVWSSSVIDGKTRYTFKKDKSLS